MIAVTSLTGNALRECTGVEDALTLQWTIESDRRNTVQDGFEVQIVTAEGDICHESGPVSGSRPEYTCRCSWRSVSRYAARVRVQSGGEVSPWAELPFVTALRPGETGAGSFVTAEREEDRDSSFGTLLRGEITLTGTVREAFLLSTACGLCHVWLNGQRVSSRELSPGWTSYHRRLLYQTDEVTHLLHRGKNVLGAALGAGWYKGTAGYKHFRNLYGTRTAFYGQLVVRYEDGREERFCTDESWKGSRSPVLFSEIYDGETCDARLEQDGWSSPGFDDSGWTPADTVEQDRSALLPQTHPPVRIMGRLGPPELILTPGGDRVLNFRQNLTGWCEAVLEHTQPGEVLELEFFEVLDAEGNVYRENLRGAKQTFRWVCRGAEREVCRPWFTFFGFQYARVVSCPGELRPESFTACVVHSDLEETASFRCSSPLVSQLWHNILWGMKGNFVDVPTDCPQRDERLGWTGDIQAFAGTACFLMDIGAFARKWLADLAADQSPEGEVPHVVPDILTGHMGEDWLLDGSAFQGGASGWGDAAVVLPWTLWLMRGDRETVERQMPSMLAWLKFLDSCSDGCLCQGPDQFGDWLALDAEPGSWKGATPDLYTSAAWYCRSTELTGRMLTAAGRREEGAQMCAKAAELRRDFCRRFLDGEGNLTVQTQTAHVLALAFDLIPRDLRRKTGQRLADLVDEAGGHLTTGFMGTPHLLQALSSTGHLKKAYSLLMREDFPGWLYQVKRGATTVWEHWDGIRPDGSMWSPEMNSFNHYAYGSVGEWLVHTAGGIVPDSSCPGFEHFFICPRPGGGLTWAETCCRTVRGPVRVRWDLDGDVVTLHTEIPANTRADVVLWGASEILETGGLAFEGNRAAAGSGSWKFRWRLNQEEDGEDGPEFFL